MGNNMIVVFSSGRSGTNLVLEVLTSSKELTYDIEYPEDKMLFRRNIIYPNNYLTKCDSIYVDGYNQFEKFMLNNNHCKMLWTIRHPYDWCMSKLYRGRKKDEDDSLADDATIEGCISDMYYMFSIYIRATKDEKLKNMIMTVKMEDVLTNITEEAKRICRFTNIKYNELMDMPHKRMRHIEYKNKHSNYEKINSSNLYIWKEKDTIYDEFFIKNNIDLDKLFVYMNPLVKHFDY